MDSISVSKKDPDLEKMVVADNVSGRIRPAIDVSFADKVIEAKKTKDRWEVIELLVNAWAERTPEDFQAFKVHLQDLKETRIDKKFGTTPDKDMDRRMIIAFPEKLMYMIRAVYKVDELPMNRTFYREFAKRFRVFQIPEKI